MTTNSTLSKPAQRVVPIASAASASKRGPIMVLRPGALDYRTYPSLAGAERLPYKPGTHLGEK